MHSEISGRPAIFVFSPQTAEIHSVACRFHHMNPGSTAPPNVCQCYSYMDVRDKTPEELNPFDKKLINERKLIFFQLEDEAYG